MDTCNGHMSVALWAAIDSFLYALVSDLYVVLCSEFDYYVQIGTRTIMDI